MLNPDDVVGSCGLFTVRDFRTVLRGEAAERYTLAVWTDGQYAYSLRLSDGQSTEVWQRLLAGVRTEG